MRLYLTFIYFAEADTDRFPYMYAAIFFPLMCAGLAAIILIGFMRFVKGFLRRNLPFAPASCLDVLFLQEQGHYSSENTRTPESPQWYSRQQLQGKFFKKTPIFLDVHELMWDMFNLGKHDCTKDRCYG